MKKIYYTFITALLAINFTNAQNVATPNPGFENWTQTGNFKVPDNWNTLNPNTGGFGILTAQQASGADAHSGSFAIKLVTKNVIVQVANGIASTATLVTSPPYGVSGGIPYTARPDSIVGWYKYSPATAADSGFAEIVLLGAANDTVGFARFTTPNTPVTTYTRFSKAVTYFSTANPVNSYWILTSSDGVNPVINSTLYVDDIDFIFNSSGINNLSPSNTITVVNNFVDDILIVKSDLQQTAQLNITDANGKLVTQFKIKNGTSNLNLMQLPSGVYFYQVINSDKTNNGSGKFVKR